MKYDHLKSWGCYILVLFPQIFKNYEISTNVTDNNTKFTTKSEDIVICGSCEIYICIYIISICKIYMFTVCTHFAQCIKTVERLFRVATQYPFQNSLTIH